MTKGWKSSEFWLTLGMNVLAFAVAFGIVPVADKDAVSGALTQAITGAFALASGAAVLWRYIASRQALKQDFADYRMQSMLETQQSPDMHYADPHELATAFASIPEDARREAHSVGMPLLTLILLAFQHRDDLAKLIDAIRKWKPF